MPKLKPHSPACERNRQPIEKVLRQEIPATASGVLWEIGSGSGQHAIYFAPVFPHLKWIASDQPSYHEGIQLWFAEFPQVNVTGPVAYTVGESNPPVQYADYVFTANTFHIMAWSLVQQCIADVASVTKKGAKFFVYGPFNYEGKFTSKSNEQFHESLQEMFPGTGGIRDFEAVQAELQNNSFALSQDHAMPANNRLLVFVRQ